MTGALDAEMRDTAKELADELGKPVTITRETSSFDPSTGDTTTTTTDYNANAAPPEQFNLDKVDGTLVQAGDVILAVPAKGLSISPNTSDKAKFDGDTYTIASVRPRYSGEQVALWELQLRK